jgi:hypothetical protein
MPASDKRPSFYEYLHESDAYSLAIYIQEQVRLTLGARRSHVLDDRNIHSYRHGTRWSHDISLADTSEMKSIAAESVVHTSDVIDHEVSIIPSFVETMTEQMYGAIMTHLYQTVGDAAEAIGNTIGKEEHLGNIPQGFLAMLRKIEFGVDRYGHPQRPSLHVGPSQGEKLIKSLQSQSLEFHLEVEKVSLEKEKKATSREADRISRFRWKPN